MTDSLLFKFAVECNDKCDKAGSAQMHAYYSVLDKIHVADWRGGGIIIAIRQVSVHVGDTCRRGPNITHYRSRMHMSTVHSSIV